MVCTCALHVIQKEKTSTLTVLGTAFKPMYTSLGNVAVTICSVTGCHNSVEMDLSFVAHCCARCLISGRGRPQLKWGSSLCMLHRGVHGGFDGWLRYWCGDMEGTQSMKMHGLRDQVVADSGIMGRAPKTRTTTSWSGSNLWHCVSAEALIGWKPVYPPFACLYLAQ